MIKLPAYTLKVRSQNTISQGPALSIADEHPIRYPQLEDKIREDYQAKSLLKKNSPAEATSFLYHEEKKNDYCQYSGTPAEYCSACSGARMG